MRPIVVIPARLAATRLPNKPLAEIAGRPMIVQTALRAREADVGRVAIAAAEPEIARAAEAAGIEAVLTEPALPSGSDRVAAALETLDPYGVHDAVVNLQGDLPTIEPDAIRAVVEALSAGEADIATLIAAVRDDDERDSPNVVKCAASLKPGARIGRALYFSRATIPSGEGAHWHHIGVYAFRRASLRRFVASPPSPLETRERLEQLRALEMGMRIDVAVVDAAPFGVDTEADLARARAVLEPS